MSVAAPVFAGLVGSEQGAEARWLGNPRAMATGCLRFPSRVQTCLGETRYANNNQLPFTYLKVGSVICTKDFANGLVGTIRINEIPSNSGPSQYWKVSMTVWRGPRR